VRWSSEPRRTPTFFEQNVLMTAMSQELGRRGHAGRGQRSTQQPVRHRIYENKGLAYRILSGKAASLRVCGAPTSLRIFSRGMRAGLWRTGHGL
jgi:hypothetical protein